MAKKTKSFNVQKLLGYTAHTLTVISLTILWYNYKLTKSNCEAFNFECYKENVKDAFNYSNHFDLYLWTTLTVIMIANWLFFLTSSSLYTFKAKRNRNKARRRREE